MKTSNLISFRIIAFLAIVVIAGGTVLAQTPSGSGVMVAGELWDSFLSPNVAPYYGEAALPLFKTFLRIGNFERQWYTPTHVWPGGWTNGNYWAKGMYLTEFNPDSTWNPATIGGNANPAFMAAAGNGRYAFGGFKSTVLGAGDPTRNYRIQTRWVDSTKRHYAIYETGWPTNIGVDVKVKVHQFSSNWNNLNDFIIVEITLTNTGILDMNADGTSERTGNVIRALTMLTHGEFMSSCFLGRSGGRGANRFGAQRMIGYVGDNDPKGSPWDMMVGFPGESVLGLKDMGFNDFPLRSYTEVWSGWAWLAVKQGTAASNLLYTLPDKTTIYGTHGIGTGAQRGWYGSGGQGRGLGVGSAGGGTNPRDIHTAAMGTWYADGGKSRDATLRNFAYNPKFFLSGTAGDPTTFVANPTAISSPSESNRPNGDRKLFSLESSSAFEFSPYESDWTKGFAGPNNFDGDMFSGIGPFSLGVGESITIVWAEVGGYRFRGVADAMAAARWAFGNGYAIPDYPSVPEVTLENTISITTKVRWDNRAETGPNFAGYKIYKSNQVLRFDWLQSGMRGLDEYWKNPAAGTTPSNLLQPVNPNFAAFDFVRTAIGAPDSWGPYQLIAVIPAGQLSQYQDSSIPGYSYSYEDKEVQIGGRNWYYVAAYTSGGTYDMGTSYAGYKSASTTTVETANINRNGASGLWQGTYPFADLNAFFPQTAAGRKMIGAEFIAQSPARTLPELQSGAFKISAKPNPYKKRALVDNPIDAFDHRVVFYNLPPKGKITILDVSGQIIQELPFDSPTSGYREWTLFSKDGVEVASGLYIYIVDYDGGQHIGYVSILR